MSSSKGKLFRWLWVFLYFIIYLGFFFHRSVRPVLFGYSLDHLILLVLLALPLGIPWVWMLICRRLGTRKSNLLLILIALSILIAYALTSMTYYNLQRLKPPFDPYLQARPLPIDQAKNDQILAQRDKPDRPILVMTLGGSTSIQYPTLLLEKLRQRHPDLQFELINLAQNSYSIKHALIRFGTHFDQWKPDIVIGLFGINEMVRSFSAETMAVGPYDDEWSHFFAFTINAVRLPTLEYLIWDRLQYSWYRTFRVHAVETPLDQFRSLKPYQQHLKRLADLIHHTGAKGLYLTQPTLYKAEASEAEKNLLSIQITQCLTKHSYWNQEYPSVTSLASAMKAYNQAMAKVATEYGIHLLDLDGAIPKDTNYFSDDCHWTPRGTEQVADLIARELADKGLLKRGQLEKTPP